ncbi:MAG: glycosyltransferase family 2 protein [Candidatus Pacebacteria bacterium]|nr:glycosyltransferase family 2 protein [Candidatus Paceibacterota bacterium]
MTKLKKLTAVILTKNEAKNLPRCLKSLAFAGTILVIDDGSIDQTVEIAEKAGARVFKRRLDDFSSQRNFALTKVKTSWVLMVDADEEVTPSLASEISQAIKKKNYSGFAFRRKNLIFGSWVKHSGWYPDWQLHLFKTKKGCYQGRVHERNRVKGKTGQLQAHLIHHNYESISHFLHSDQFDQYASLEAEQLAKNGYGFFWPDLIKKPVDEFLRRFFAEKGYLDGLIGLILAVLQAFKEFVIYAKVWERSPSQPELPPEEFLGNLSQEFSRKQREIDFWLFGARAKTGKNFFKKLFLTLQRKISQ